MRPDEIVVSESHLQARFYRPNICSMYFRSSCCKRQEDLFIEFFIKNQG
jgi:hypothetical protein